MPGTPKVLESSLTRTCFFFQTGYIVSKKIVGRFFVCLSFLGLVVTSWNCFFFYVQFFNVVFNV